MKTCSRDHIMYNDENINIKHAHTFSRPMATVTFQLSASTLSFGHFSGEISLEFVHFCRIQGFYPLYAEQILHFTHPLDFKP